jgi:hypothetical protein
LSQGPTRPVIDAEFDVDALGLIQCHGVRATAASRLRKSFERDGRAA